MKRAALYARVSTEIQKEEGTIESQVYELKRQIERDGNIVVKEYADEGYSGARLDRPALNELRADLKMNLFDVIYFHNVDRIARDVTYQQIILADILKFRKQLIINGKDYVENPENKFALTVLGAVAELEKAKFAERSVRGRRHKVRQGIPATGGNPPYGYTHLKKTETERQRIVVHEQHAPVVRFIYDQYVNTNISINELTRVLQLSEWLPKHGGVWCRSTVHFILSNTAYFGEIHYYTVRKVPAHGSAPRHVKFRTVPRDESEHMTLSVPPIVSREVWERAQTKLNRNKQKHRNPYRKYLLSGLVECGRDGKSYTGSAQTRDALGLVKYRSYGCNHNRKMGGADYSLERDRCGNKQVSAARLEIGVWLAIVREVLNPARLKTHVEALRTRTRDRDDEHRKKLRAIERALRENREQRERVLDLYAEGGRSKEMFWRKAEALEDEERKLRGKQSELASLITTVPDPIVIRRSIALYCEEMSRRASAIKDYAGKRAFLLDVIDRIVIDDELLHVRGFVPLAAMEGAQHGDHREPSAVYCPRGEQLRVRGREPDCR